MRIFVNNVDGFLAGAICAELMKLSHSIMGTQKGSHQGLVPPMVKKIIPRIEVRKLLKTVASCDLVIYDLHDADLEELELVLRTLHISELTQDMVFILVSSVGIWARTQRDFEVIPDTRSHAEHDVPEPDAAAAGASVPPPAAGAEPAGEETPAPPVAKEQPPEPPKRPAMLKGEDYIRRVPTPKFQEWKTIETLTLALKRKGNIRPYVVCAGVPYGNGEEAFLGLFKAAWQNKDTLRIIGSGANYIPMVHARDCARLVRIVAAEKPSMEYHLAVDRGELTQRALVQSVGSEFGIAYDIRSVNVAEAILAELADILTLDLRLEPSPLMEPSPAKQASAVGSGAAVYGDSKSEQGSRAEGSRATSAEPAGPPPVRFRWWSEEGLAANVGKVAEEFCKWRRLDPVHFLVLGPPGSPTADFAARLGERYALPALAFDKIIEEMKNHDTPLGQQLRDKLDEISAAHHNPKASGPFLLQSALATQLAEAALNTKPARYRGWVLAGYPQTPEECAVNFMQDAPPKEPDEGEEAGDAAEAPPPPPPTKGGGKAASVEVPAPEEKVPRSSWAIDVLVILSCPEDICQQTVQAMETPMPDKEFQLKMDRWKKERPELEKFFVEKFSCEVVELEAQEDLEVDAEIQKIAEALEAKRRVANFLPPAKRTVGDQVEEEDKVERTKGDEEQARAEAELRRKKKDQEEKLEQIRREENTRLERHSEPLRQYMSCLVVPTLAKGLVEVCRKQPEDPVGYLAEYLSVYSELARKHGKKPPSRRTSVA
mmetsp:Transcript_24982/g.79359  ORF Transcript_24982/g.79359 Transcript_24982/m.79359 type:complete len:771 (+) Transcript_24982:64-2376(+)